MAKSIMFSSVPKEGGQYELPSDKPRIRTRITPELMRSIRGIESGGNPNARTGKYKGLYQLSDDEFKRLGGKGDIFNGKENERIAALKLQNEADQVANKLGRELTPGEIYLVHQQGVGGSYEHITKPDRPAWQSMHATGEGRNKGEGWSRLAIWGNVPDKDKARYGSVENLTSGEFAKMWNARVLRGMGQGGADTASVVQPAATVVPNPLDDPEGNTASPASPASPAAETQANIAEAGGGEPNKGALAEVAGDKTKSKQEIAGDAFSGLGELFAKGPVAQNAARASGPANLPSASLPMPPGIQPVVDPRIAEAQRQQLAMALQRLNSRKLY
jgi:hypothetical protein